MSDSVAARPTTARRRTTSRGAERRIDRRWPAAYELSRLMADPKVRADRTLGPSSSRRSSERRDDPRSRVSRAGDRPPRSAAAARSDCELTRALDRRRRDAHQRDLGARLVGRRRGRAALQPLYSRRTHGIRKMVVYALGALPGDAQMRRCARRCRTRADVRWNAAVALARKGSHDGVPVLQQMLDRAVRRADGQARRAQDEDAIRLPT
jgi:hypothetical protein